MSQNAMTEEQLLAGMKALGRPVAYREFDWLRTDATPASTVPPPVEDDLEDDELDDEDEDEEVVWGAPLGTSAEAIIAAVCKEFRVTKEDLLSRSQYFCHVHPRQAAMYLMRITKKNRSLSIIGRFFGRDHATVRWGVKRAKKRMDETPAFFAKVSRVHMRLTGKPLPPLEEDPSEIRSEAA